MSKHKIVFTVEVNADPNLLGDDEVGLLHEKLYEAVAEEVGLYFESTLEFDGVEVASLRAVADDKWLTSSIRHGEEDKNEGT